MTVLAKVDSHAMREMNRALLLDMIRSERTVSRTELARRSELAKPTVSAIVDDLIEDGIVREIGFSVSTSKKGRRSRLLELNEASAAFVGIHFGVRHTGIAVADARGQVRVTRHTTSFRGQSRPDVHMLVPLVAEAMSQAKLPRSRLRGVGVALPALVDHATGTCVLAPNLRWYDLPLRDMISAELKAPVTVRNITQAAAVAEGRFGAARGVRTFVWVYVGSGIGAAIVIDGRVFYGKDGYSGELGHCAVVMSGGATCGCGRIGCLETVASGSAIEAAARASLAGREKSWGRASRELDAHSVAVAAREGDRTAQGILRAAGHHLGTGISYLINLVNPDMVVVGGRVVQAGGYFVDPVREAASRRALRGETVPIVTSTVGEDIMLKGAVLFAMEGDRVQPGARLGSVA